MVTVNSELWQYVKWIPIYDEEPRAHLMTISPTMRAISRAAQVEETTGPNTGDVDSTGLSAYLHL